MIDRPPVPTGETGSKALRSMMIGDVCVSTCAEDGFIGLDRGGEGGWFSLEEFMEVLHQFISDRL